MDCNKFVRLPPPPEGGGGGAPPIGGGGGGGGGGGAPPPTGGGGGGGGGPPPLGGAGVLAIFEYRLIFFMIKAAVSLSFKSSAEIPASEKIFIHSGGILRESKPFSGS